MAARDDVIALANGFQVGLDAADHPFIVPHDGPNVALFAGSAKRMLNAIHVATHGKAVGRTALDEAFDTLAAQHHNVERQTLPIRVARHDGGIVIDLGDQLGRAVVVSASGWEVVERSPVTFRRSRATKALPVPECGGSLGDLWSLVRFAPDSQVLMTAWLVSALFEDMPHPAPAFRGEQGSGKSTATRIISSLIDPCVASTQHPPRDDKDWGTSCRARWVVAVDNVSAISEWWSDSICRTVTGDGTLVRELYSDDEIVVNRWRRCVILNGITLGATLRPDLAERLLLLDLERPDGDYRTEREIDDQFAAEHGRILGALLDMTSATLRELQTVEPVRDLRMADFATLLRAFDQAHGTDALEAFRADVDTAFTEAIESDPLVDVLRSFMADRDSWEGTTSDLHAALLQHTQYAGLPANARALSSHLRRSVPGLRRVGISWEPPTKRGHQRVARLTRTGTQTDDGDAKSPLVAPLLDLSTEPETRGTTGGDLASPTAFCVPASPNGHLTQSGEVAS